MRLVPMILLFAYAPLFAQAASECTVPSAGEDGWPVAAPASVGLGAATLCPVAAWLEEWKQANVHDVLVARHGKLVFERYFAGDDERWGARLSHVPFGPKVKHDERSITKSVTSLLVGIALDRGWIKSIDEPVFSFFPEYKDIETPEKDRITLRHLLTMSAGLKWIEDALPYSDANSEYAMDRAADPYRYVLEQTVVAPPGEVYEYNSGGTELLGAVLRKATGKPLDELARALLFTPLGITDLDWHRNQGHPSAAAGLALRARDLAKIGQLILQRGAWKGAQIVPAAWIDAATTPHINGQGAFFYGYQFWLGRSFVGGREVHWAAGWGLGGQRLFVVPELDLVVVVNAGLYRSDLQGPVPLNILNRYVLAATQTHP